MIKQVVSVSLGSAKRNHAVEAELLGQPFRIERRGTDGDMAKAMALIQELDGTVDAFGLGGLDVYLYVGSKRYVIGDGLKLMEAAKKTPAVDGSGIKNTLEREAIRWLAKAAPDLLNKDSHVLLVSAMDRFGMAEALVELGCDAVFGDLIFAMAMDHPIRTLQELEYFADKFRSRIEKLPLSMLYPTGKAQDEAPVERYPKYYAAADVIAGDFHFIKHYMPARLDGKVIITNTTTADDVAMLQQRGVRSLVTTTPILNGRSFGTNVLEAALVALSGAGRALTPEEYQHWIGRLDLRPTIRTFAQV